VKDLDAKFDQYERSINPAERKKLAEEIQRGILENYYLVPVPPRVRSTRSAPGSRRRSGRTSSDRHHRLCLSVGGPEGEGAVSRTCRSSIIRRVLYSLVTLFILSATILPRRPVHGGPGGRSWRKSQRARPKTSTASAGSGDWTARGPCSM